MIGIANNMIRKTIGVGLESYGLGGIPYKANICIPQTLLQIMID
jgi:hypothetical protein